MSLPTKFWSSTRHQLAASSWRQASSYLCWYTSGSVSGTMSIPLSCIVLLAQLDFTLATHCCRSEAQPAVQPEVRLAAVQTYASCWKTRFIKSLPQSSVELLENGF